MSFSCAAFPSATVRALDTAKKHVGLCVPYKYTTVTSGPVPERSA